MSAEKPEADSKEVVFGLNSEDWRKVIDGVRRNPKLLFLSKNFRRLVAVRRAELLNLPMLVKEVPEKAIVNTIPHNAVMIPKFIEAHSARLTNALVTIDPIFGKEGETSILAIGPRNEMELFLLYGLGFDPAKVKAIDLISNSPLITVGDMHAIPHPDSSFDAVLCGWTLAYSTDHQRAVDEMVRVCKPNGLVAIGLSYIPVGHKDRDMTASQGSIAYDDLSALLALFGNRAAEVPFRHEPLDKSQKGALMAVVRVAKPA